MKNIIIILLFIVLFSSKVFTDSTVLFNFNFEYSLPSSKYLIQKQSNASKEMLLIKFPQYYSEKYQINIIPNLAIIADKVPEELTLDNYLFTNLNTLYNYPGYNQFHGKDDLMECGINGTSMYHEYIDSKNITHSVYTVFYKKGTTGLMIMYDATDDIYLRSREELKKILKSMQISEKKKL